jgi:hypothetical protein
MTTISDETLGAYVDGELDAASRATVEQAIAADPALMNRVSAQRALRERLRNAYAGALSEPVPARLIEAAREVGAASHDGSQSSSTTRSRRSRPTGWLALAASIVIAVALVPRLQNRPDSSSLVVSNDGKRVAQGALAAQLSTALASMPDRTASPVHIGLSYRARSGEYCRTFEARDNASVQAGVACHESSGEWRIEALEPVAGGGSDPSAMRQAASHALPEPLRRHIEATIDGDPLDSDAETAAAKAGWPTAPAR